jgi:hypothetical protein
VADFASPTDLRHFLGMNAEGLDMGRAKRLLSQATRLIKAHCHQQIERVAGDVLTLTGRGEVTLLLPEIPVVSVASITEDGVAVTAAEYDLDLGNGILRRLSSTWGRAGDPSVIVVTYTHGYQPIPQEVREVCEAVAGRAFTHASASTMTLDGLQEGRGWAVGMMLTEDECNSLDDYSLPYALSR